MLFTFPLEYQGWEWPAKGSNQKCKQNLVLNVFFSQIFTNLQLLFSFFTFFRFFSLRLQPECFQLHTKSKGSSALSHTASSTKVRITGYFTTSLSPSSFLRIVTSSHFVFGLIVHSQDSFVLFIYFCPCILTSSFLWLWTCQCPVPQNKQGLHSLHSSTL